VRPNVVTAEPAGSAGKVETQAPSGSPELPLVKVVDRVQEAAAAASIEDARIIVAGGRGVGGPEGFELVQQLAERLGGAVGATLAKAEGSGIGPHDDVVGAADGLARSDVIGAWLDRELPRAADRSTSHIERQLRQSGVALDGRHRDREVAGPADRVVNGELRR